MPPFSSVGTDPTIAAYSTRFAVSDCGGESHALREGSKARSLLLVSSPRLAAYACSQQKHHEVLICSRGAHSCSHLRAAVQLHYSELCLLHGLRRPASDKTQQRQVMSPARSGGQPGPKQACALPHTHPQILTSSLLCHIGREDEDDDYVSGGSGSRSYSGDQRNRCAPQPQPGSRCTGACWRGSNARACLLSQPRSRRGRTLHDYTASSKAEGG
jgi:hypothetical protein